MSRCFPFPPPGYEKKPTTDDLDLLKKEKRKEKKHKKDKKDKEKKEGKEKREKDRSEGKHKEKKDKKDKHRDKKKDKDKDKDKGKTSTTTTQDEGYNGDKLNHNNEPIQDKKQSLQFRNGESHKDRTTTSSSFDEKQVSTQFQGQNGDLARNRDTENYKFVQELDRRIRDEEKGTGSHQFFVEGRKNSFNNKVEMQNAMARNKINGATPPLQLPPQPPLQPPLPPPPQPPLDKKAERKVQESDDRRGDKRKSKDRDKRREKDGEKEKKEEKSKERSERDKHKHSKKSDSNATFNNVSTNHLENSFQGVGSEGILKKRKESESNGVFHENEPRPNKMARPISDISPENGRKLDLPQNPSSSLLDSQTQSQSQSQRASQNNFKMASTKSQKVNGMIIPSSPVSVSVSLPPKKPPTPAFNHIHHKPSPIKSPPPPPPPPVITNHVSGQSPPVTTTKPPPPVPPPQIPVPVKQPVSRPKPPPAVVKAAAPPPPPPKKKTESVKPPHPDTKYLNQILTVPKPEEWGGVDEQEWLLRPAAPPPAKAAVAEVQVWSEAKHIDSVDVCALPYVIPY